MICPRCGTINPDDAERCTRCRGSLVPPPPRETIDGAAAEEPENRPAAVGGPQQEPENPSADEGRDAPPGAGGWPPPPETPTWPPPWPVPSGPPPPGPWPPPSGPPTQPGSWGPPPGSPPPAPLQGPGWDKRSITTRTDGGGPRPNYFVWAVLCTVLFNPIGIVAVIFCVIANRRFASGDTDGGIRAAHLAKTWCWVSVIVFMIGLLLLASGVIKLPARGG